MWASSVLLKKPSGNGPMDWLCLRAQSEVEPLPGKSRVAVEFWRNVRVGIEATGGTQA